MFADEIAKAAGASIRILLVEDHLLTRIGLKTVLERTKEFTVIAEAENGQDAVNLAAELQPDLVLMDVGLPIIDGIEAARLIKEQCKDMPIVMFTSHDSEQDIFASLAAGARGYCLKDVEPERLCSAIRSVAAGDLWIDSTIAGKVLNHYGHESMSGGNPAHSGRAEFNRGLVEPLSPREMEVLSLLVDGLSNQEIADKLIISLATAKTHVRNILNKLAVDDRTQAAVHAMRKGLV